MGSCCCKTKDHESGLESPPPGPDTIAPASGEPPPRLSRHIDAKLVDQLVLEMLAIITSYVDKLRRFSEESPVPLVKLHVIADHGDGWIQVVSSLVNVIPLEDPLGPSAITIVFDDCPLPSKETVIKLTKYLRLNKQRALKNPLNVRVERNICIVLGCIADKLAGPNSVAVLTEDTVDYLLTFLTICPEPCVVLFAVIALEKFAQTTENNMTIRRRLDKERKNPLVLLEVLADNKNYTWRQVGFCAKWALDNYFVIAGRKLSYELVDMTNINVLLNARDVSEYLKISCNGLEARCDSTTFESVRSTFQVDSGCWYYECTLMTPGVMQIGWATKSSRFLNQEGFGVGDDVYSVSYDGCRKLIWHKAKHTSVRNMPEWQPGDVLGCLIDLERKEIIFSINGQRMRPYKEIFETNQFGFFAAASFMAFQQCLFNFGHEPFQFLPKDRPIKTFNDHGTLTNEQKKVIPRRIYMEKLRCTRPRKNCCTLCFDDAACCVLEPCMHRGFCSVCTTMLKECPLCRADILNIRREIK